MVITYIIENIDEQVDEDESPNNGSENSITLNQHSNNIVITKANKEYNSEPICEKKQTENFQENVTRPLSHYVLDS